MKKTRGKKRWLLKWILPVSLACTAFYFAYPLASEQSITDEAVTASPISAQAAVLPTSTPLQEKELALVEVDVNSIETDNYLRLVNHIYPIAKENFEVDNVSAYRVVPVLSSDVSMEQKTLEAVTDLVDAAKELGFTKFLINYGYRDYDEQKELYDNARDKSLVAKPGHSEHHTGLAIDIAYKGISGKQMGESQEGKWLADNAWKYGFILRYPGDKTEITNISYEPWHFRYVGLPHAYYCYTNNLCFEEYIRFLEEGGEYSVTIDDVKYSVFYQTPQYGIIQLPKDLACKISDDNTGGFIVTTEEY